MTKQKQIIDSYLSGNYDSDISRDFANWLDSPVDCDLKQEAMQEAWNNIHAEKDSSTSEAFKNLQARLATQGLQTKSRGFSRARWIHTLRTAAIIVLPIVAAALTYVLTSSIFKANVKPVAQWEEVYCPYGQTKTVDLPDGSRISLNAGSRLVYPTAFTEQTRKVFLSGEAYADIAKDPERKFIVSANDLDIIVHGTSFNVRTYPEDSEIEVMLVSGSIDMMTKTLEHNRTVSMTPGDLVRLDHMSGAINVENVPVESFRRDSRLTFVNCRLKDIATQLERVFNTRIVIENHSLEDQRFLASFVNGESLDDILNLLKQTSGLKYKKQYSTIYIN